MKDVLCEKSLPISDRKALLVEKRFEISNLDLLKGLVELLDFLNNQKISG